MSFRFLTAGESHGKALIGIIEGLPAGLDLTHDYLMEQARRRKLGYGRGARQKIETDAIEILSGVRHGQTIGSPIALMITNRDFSAWKEIMQSEPFTGEVRRPVEVPRPGHADLVGGIKYAHSDMRNVLERSSARETAMRVALGSVARRFLEALGISIASRIVQIGDTRDESPVPAAAEIASLNQRTDASSVRVLDSSVEPAMVATIEKAKKEGNTLGGIFEVFAAGVPVGLGSYAQWDRRLEAEIGRAFLSLNAIKGVEIGLGFEAGRILGTIAHDEILPPGPAEKSAGARYRYASNRSGGIDGGMSTGQPIIVRAAMKPLATLMKPLQSVDLGQGEVAQAHIERSDVCAAPAAAVIGESLLALSLAAAILEKFGSDSMQELLPRVDAWQKNAR